MQRKEHLGRNAGELSTLFLLGCHIYVEKMMVLNDLCYIFKVERTRFNTVFFVLRVYYLRRELQTKEESKPHRFMTDTNRIHGGITHPKYDTPCDLLSIPCCN